MSTQDRVADSDWFCAQCRQQAADDEDGTPKCINPMCPYFFSIVPNFRH